MTLNSNNLHGRNRKALQLISHHLADRLFFVFIDMVKVNFSTFYTPKKECCYYFPNELLKSSIHGLIFDDKERFTYGLREIPQSR